jgi:hypothetical protein
MNTKIKTSKKVDRIKSMDSEIFWNVGHFITIVHKDYIER